MSFKIVEPAPARLNRSELAVPGSSPKLFEKAAKSAADVIFLDLEDAVHPDSKAAARAAIWTWQESAPSVACQRFIRLNGVSSALFRQDLTWLGDMRYPERCTGVFLPKAEAPQALARVVEQLLA